MELDILTLSITTCLVYLCQVIAIYVQYRINKSLVGMKWWLVGTTFSALGVIFMPMVMIPSLLKFSMVAIPLTILGQLVLYIGVVRFLGKREKKWVLVAIFGFFILAYYYFMFGINSISYRTLVFTAISTILLLMSAISLFRFKGKGFSGSAIFTGAIFLLYGIFSIGRFIWVLFLPQMKTYFDQESGLSASFIVPLIANVLWTYGFIIMLNQRLNTENLEEKEKLQRIFNTTPDAAVISRAEDGLIIDVNAGFPAMTGYTRSELIGNTTLGINFWKNISDRDRFVSEVKKYGVSENREFIFVRKDGTQLFGRISAKTILIESEVSIISIIHDITNKKLADQALRNSEALYRSILDSSPDDITITDAHGYIQMISPAAKKMFGYGPDYEGYVGSHLLENIIPEDRERAVEHIKNLLDNGVGGTSEYKVVRKGGVVFDIEVNSGVIRDIDGQTVKMIFLIRDISERKVSEEKIQQLVHQLELEKKTAQRNANTDSLTGLANRRYFDESFKLEFQRMSRSGESLSLLMLDVDRFKSFNDYYGHLAGDNCLRQIGTTLTNNVTRVTDIVARYGGEEFVLILVDTDQDGAIHVAQHIRMAVEALAIPHLNSDVAEVVTITAGVVTVNPSKLLSMDRVVAMADEALYRAKAEGRNRIAVYAELPTK
ncbi:MAG TPA: sensor domain-containing diguanylate cyclase [Anaerolineaceae bacterium]|nr:sensor domain-containing diguanylate cyclase [Anaerolineaceae bacterium]